MIISIKIPINITEFYKWSMARFFATNLPDRYRYMKEIIQMLQKNEEINNKIMETYGDKYDTIMKQIEFYSELDVRAELIRNQLADAFKNNYYSKAESLLNKELKQIASKIAPIQKPIIQTWYLMIKDTDLAHQNIPREEILHPDKLPFKGTPSHDTRLDSLSGTL